MQVTLKMFSSSLLCCNCFAPTATIALLSYYCYQVIIIIDYSDLQSILLAG